MSGGAYNYVSQSIDYAMYELQKRSEGPEDVRLKLLEPMRLLSLALHELEWFDSADTSEPDAAEAACAEFLEHWKP